MDTIMKFCEEKLMPIASKLSSNKYLSAIQTGLVATMPFLIFGSLCMIIVAFPINEYILSEATIIKLNDFFSHAYTICMNMTALVVAFSIAYNICLKNDVEPLYGGFLGLFSFVMLIPLTGEGAISFDSLGGQGLFLAIICSILSAILYCKFISKGWTIKLPDTVPPAISKSFMSLVPIIVILMIFVVVRNLFVLTPYGTAMDFIYSVLQVPLMKLGSTPGSVLFAAFFCELCWFFGLHGGLIVMSVYEPILLALAAENDALVAAGQQAANVVNYNFYSVFFASLGGDAAFLMAAVVLIWFTHREDLKDIGKLGFASSIFNITEPIVYGLPVVLNPFMFIPLCIGPILELGLAYILSVTGFCPYAANYVPWTMPPVLSGWIATGSWKGAVTQLLELVIGFVLWYFAIKMYEKQLDKDTKEK